MKIILNIENDNELRDHIKNAIDGQVKSIVRQQIEKTITDEVARVLPIVANRWAFEERIDKAIENSITQIVKKHSTDLGFSNQYITALINKKLSQLLDGNDWKKIIDDMAKAKIKSMIDSAGE